MLFFTATLDGYRLQPVLTQQGQKGSKVRNGVFFLHTRQVDQQGIVVKKVWRVAKTLCKVLRKLPDVGAAQQQCHQGQLGTLDLERQGTGARGSG